MKNIHKEVLDWVYDQLHRELTYMDITNSYDVHAINVRAIEILDEKYKPATVTDEKITIDVEATIDIDVLIKTENEDCQIWDSDSKETTAIDTIMKEVKRQIKIEYQMSLANEDFYQEWEIESINNDEDLELEDEDRIY